MINIIGTFLGTSGYDIHTRELANALNKLTKVRLEALIPGNLANQLNDQEVEMLKREPDDEINLIITNPIHWRLNTNAKRNWVYLIHEGDKIPKSWIKECLNPDIEYIFVPSKHTHKALRMGFRAYYDSEDGINHASPEGQVNISLKDKIKLIPHGVDLEKFYPPQVASTSNDGEPTSMGIIQPVVFLCNKGFRNLEDRGGIQYAIKAYLEEFNPEDNTELILKLNPAYGIPDVDKLINQLKPDKKELPKVQIDIGNYKYKDLVKLYHKADVFVSPTRAESFNIPCLEAMACGLPVITTDFGGQTDFCSNDTGWIVSGELSPVEHEIQYEGIKWLTPSLTQLKQAMREAHGKTHTQKAQKAKEIAKEYTWEITAKKILELLR